MTALAGYGRQAAVTTIDDEFDIRGVSVHARSFCSKCEFTPNSVGRCLTEDTE